jgi:dTMP kinase
MGNKNLKNKLSGKFIVLDGPDGCGKTTQAKLLAQWLSEQGVPTETFRDPGATAIGEKISDFSS